jgi:DNA-binding MarR family transcriptional regulator
LIQIIKQTKGMLMQEKSANRRKAAAPRTNRSAAGELMEFFYPVHYEIGIALEDVVRADQLLRPQAASLWLLRSQGEDGRRMRRKEIEANLRRWFEITSAAVSRALRAMMRPPLELIEMSEDPRSGREKLVALTPKGKAFVDSVAARATQVLADLIEDAPPEVVDSAILYFRHLTGSFQRSRTRTRIRIVQPSVRDSKKANPNT